MTNKNYHHTQEAKDKISKYQKGRIKTQIEKQKLQDAWKKKVEDGWISPNKEQLRPNTSKALKGRHHTEKTKQKMRKPKTCLKCISANQLIEKLEDKIENKQKEIGEEYKKGFVDGKEEGYMEGMLDGLNDAKICAYCNKHYVESIHHILPRKFNGGDNTENLIGLCFECHDKVEILTNNLLINNLGRYTIDDLRSFIKHKAFPNIEYIPIL